MFRTEEARRYRQKYADKIRAKDRERYHRDIETHKTRQKEYRERNRERERLRAAKYREENREKIRLKAKEYRERNRDKIAADGARRVRNRLKRGTIHLLYRDQIRDIYNSRKEGQQVDHIIPINGKLVSGLHVPWNLQLLDAKENNSKKNKVDLVKESRDLTAFITSKDFTRG